ncbi:unnamed protein product, partial [Didymodactylos carnosus]
AQKLHTAASKLGKTANISKYIGKEIAKTLIQTGLSELASVGIDSTLNSISNTYERELHEKIKQAVNDNWNTKITKLPEATMLKNFTSRCGPVMQGLGQALAGTKGTIQRLFNTYAPTLIGLGVNIGVEKAKNTNKQYVLSKSIESIAGANRIERLANTFELIHAASSPNDTKIKYADDLVIFSAEARAIDVNDLNIDPKDVYPANLNSESLQQVYYNVALVANKMSQSKTYDEAMKILDDNNVVKELRKDVSLAMKNDEKLLKEFRWTNRTDLKSHFISLTGYYVDKKEQLRLDDKDIEYFKTEFATANLPVKYSEMKRRKGIDDMGSEVTLADHHLISKTEIRSQLVALISTLTDEELKSTMEAYLNDPRNPSNKVLVMNGIGGAKDPQISYMESK